MTQHRLQSSTSKSGVRRSDNSKDPLVIFAIIALLIVAIGVAAWVGVTMFLPSWETRGKFGDLFGSVNALFTGLALAGVIVTMFLQRSELAMQREQLECQLTEMINSRKELAEQSRNQRGRLTVTIAQLKTMAWEAEVRALEVESQGRSPANREPYIKQIRQIADEMRKNAEELESVLMSSKKKINDQ